LYINGLKYTTNPNTSTNNHEKTLRSETKSRGFYGFSTSQNEVWKIISDKYFMGGGAFGLLILNDIIERIAHLQLTVFEKVVAHEKNGGFRSTVG
jgi:hypothetical protein